MALFLPLLACAYATETTIQDMTVVTPGAHGALCYVYVDDLRHKIRPPQTIKIGKSDNDLMVDCMAPGNRRRKVYIKPDISPVAPMNVATGVVPGLAVDYASRALFVYPSVVTVDFTHAPAGPELTPAQNNPDIRQPETYLLEEFRPGEPRLNRDRYEQNPPLERRQPQISQAEALDTLQLDPGYTEQHMQEPPPAHDYPRPPGGKSNLMDVIQNLGPVQ